MTMTDPSIQQAMDTIKGWQEAGAVEIKPELKHCPTCQGTLRRIQDASGVEMSGGAIGVIWATLFQCQSCQGRCYWQQTGVGLG